MNWAKVFGFAGCLALLGMTAISPAAAQANGAGGVLPPDFRGRIVYQGNFSAEAFRAGRAPAHASEIVRRIARGNNRSWTEDGTITVTVEYDGARIQGSHVGSGGMGRGTFTGTRNGGSCTISNGQGDLNTVSCTRAMWSGTSRSAPGARVESSVTIEARATSIVDFAEAAPARQARQSANTLSSGRCWLTGAAAPRSQQELDAIPIAGLLGRADSFGADRQCYLLFISAAALRGSPMGMAAYAGTEFGADAPNPDPRLETYWCQRAYRGARSSGIRHEMDTVNHFCPVETFAVLMTPAERRANNVSIERARRQSADIRTEAEARGREISRFFFD